jgi:hypothetical protein
VLIFLCKKFSVPLKLFKASHSLDVKKPGQLADAIEKDTENGYVVCRARDLLKLLAQLEGKK